MELLTGEYGVSWAADLLRLNFAFRVEGKVVVVKVIKSGNIANILTAVAPRKATFTDAAEICERVLGTLSYAFSRCLYIYIIGDGMSSKFPADDSRATCVRLIKVGKMIFKQNGVLLMSTYLNKEALSAKNTAKVYRDD